MADGFYSSKVIFLKLKPGGFKDFFFSNNDDIKGVFEQVFVPSEERPHPSFDFISFNSVTYFFANDNSHSGKT